MEADFYQIRSHTYRGVYTKMYFLFTITAFRFFSWTLILRMEFASTCSHLFVAGHVAEIWAQLCKWLPTCMFIVLWFGMVKSCRNWRTEVKREVKQSEMWSETCHWGTEVKRVTLFMNYSMLIEDCFRFLKHKLSIHAWLFQLIVEYSPPVFWVSFLMQAHHISNFHYALRILYVTGFVKIDPPNCTGTEIHFIA